MRFEVGVGKTISFGVRQNQSSTKYYLVADWTQEKGGKLNYGNEPYFATSTSGNAYLMVKRKNLQKTKFALIQIPPGFSRFYLMLSP